MNNHLGKKSVKPKWTPNLPKALSYHTSMEFSTLVA
jgi:hypothetical protein